MPVNKNAGGKPVELEVLKGSPGKESEYIGLYRTGERVVFAYRESKEILYKSAVLQDGKVIETATAEPDSFETRWPQRIYYRCWPN